MPTIVQNLLSAGRAIVAGPGGVAARSGSTLANPAPWLFEALGGLLTDAGETVTPAKALSIPAFWNAIRLVSETIAAMPVEVFEHNSDGTKARTREHPAAYLFSVEANPNTTWPVLCDAWITWLYTWGNGYLNATRDGLSDPIKLDILPSDRTKPMKHPTTGELVYKTEREIGGAETRARRNVIHLPGFGFDGIEGHSVVWMLRESLGEMLGTKKYSSRFWQNSARPGGYIKHPKAIGDGARRLREDWERLHRGTENAGRVAILEEGAEFMPLSLPPEDAQFLQTRKLQNADIARMFRVPLHKLQEMDRSTFNNIEHQALEFLTDTLMPLVVKAETALNQRLFAPSERGRFSVRFNIAHVLRADAKTRAEYYQKMRHAGIFNADMVLEMEDMNPLPDGRGKTVWMPTNMMPAPNPKQAEAMLEKFVAPKAKKEDPPPPDDKKDDAGKEDDDAET